MTTLYSNCCGAADKTTLSGMSYSEQGICPHCLYHCDFTNDELIEELADVAQGSDLISLAIKKAIKDSEPHTTLFEYIKSQAKDNLRMMEDVIGIELTNNILAL